MATYISLDNLARYDANAKDRAGRLYADASAACWQKTEKAGAVTCVPAPETPLEPVVEFLFKETLPSGTKGPSNPSVIEGVAQANLYHAGKNLINFPYENQSQTIRGVTFTVNANGSVVANGTASGGDAFFLLTSAKRILLLNGVSYFLSGCPSGGSDSTYFLRIGVYNGQTNTYNGNDTGIGRLYSTYSASRTSIIAVAVKNGYTANNLVFWPQLEQGTTASSYEKGYYVAHTISLPSTYYGGTLDVASGRLTVTHRMVEPSSGTVDISDRPALLPLEYTDTYGRAVTSADGTSLDCGSSGGQIVYRLANPYTVQIDPAPIDSLPALDKTSPRVNTVYTDALNVQVGYAEHPAYTEGLINNAILALGGNI